MSHLYYSEFLESVYYNLLRGLFQHKNGCSDRPHTFHGCNSYIILIHELYFVKIFCPQAVIESKIFQKLSIADIFAFLQPCLQEEG